MLLAKTVVDNTASFDWALPPGFARYRIEVEGFRPAVNQADVGFQVSTDGGSNYATTGYTHVTFWAVWNNHGGGGGAASALMYICPVGQSNIYGAQNIIATLYGAEAGLYPRVLGKGVGWNNLNSVALSDNVAEYAGSTDRVTHIRILAGSGNMTAGTFYLYGEQ